MKKIFVRREIGQMRWKTQPAHRVSCFHTPSVWPSTPSTPSMTTTAPSTTRAARSTSIVKSTWPGVSTTLTVWPAHWTGTDAEGQDGNRADSTAARKKKGGGLPTCARGGKGRATRTGGRLNRNATLPLGREEVGRGCPKIDGARVRDAEEEQRSVHMRRVVVVVDVSRRGLTSPSEQGHSR